MPLPPRRRSSDIPKDATQCPRCGDHFSPGADRAGAGTCPMCRRLEAARAVRGLAPIPPDRWPVDPEELGREYAMHIEIVRDEATP